MFSGARLLEASLAKMLKDTSIINKYNELAVDYCVFKRLLSVLCLCASLGLGPLVHAQLPDGFVDLTDAVPSVQTEVRYYSANNFVGSRVDSYIVPKVFITVDAASALGNAQDELAELGLGLKVFDAYRPQGAVDHFVRWAEDLADTSMKEQFYPLVDKENLFRDGYIAARSGHSRGSTVDLTIVDLESGAELDMGTPWDFFDLQSWPSSMEVNAQQRANRMLLRSVMMKNGFGPITTEWWHFTLENEPHPDTYFEFEIR
jgi:D-alanyl-D-alanine dipeptidase